MSDAEHMTRLVRAALTRAAPVGGPWSRQEGQRSSLARWGDPDRLLDQAEQDLADVAAVGGRFVVPGDEEWPAGVDDLRSSDEPEPFGLWVRGPARLVEVSARGVAVVGARAATGYGESVASSMAANLAAAGCAVVSGAAFGIDAAAHRGALSVRGVTAAVLAAGVDVPSPRGHAALIDRVAERGCVVSELPPGMQPAAKRFLVRNRLIAALSRGVVVVEAAERSGTKSTVRYADGMSRTVMAVPGPVTSPLSRGCHGLVRELNAMLVQDAEEVIEALGLAPALAASGSFAPPPGGSGWLAPPPDASGSSPAPDGLGPRASDSGSAALAGSTDRAGLRSCGAVGHDVCARGAVGAADADVCARETAGCRCQPGGIDDRPPADRFVLGRIAAGGPVTTGALAAASGLPQSAVMASLGRLTAQGVVVRDGVRWRLR